MSLQHLVAASALVAMPLGLAWFALGPEVRAVRATLPSPDAALPTPELPEHVERQRASNEEESELAKCGLAFSPVLAQMSRVLRAGIEEELAACAEHGVREHALRDAIQAEQTLLVRGLLTAGADPNERDTDGEPVLQIAAGGSRAEILSLLLAAGADAHASREDRTQAIHVAARWGVAASVGQLLSAGVDVDARDDQERTPLWFAASEGELASVELLLAAGARVNSVDLDGERPIHAAARSKDPAIVRALCSCGAELEARQDDGWTPLLLAASLGSPAVITALVELGANLHAVDLEGRGALHLAVARSRTENVRRLLELGIDRERRNARGETALEHGIGRVSVEALEALWGEQGQRCTPSPEQELDMQRFALAQLEALAAKGELAELRAAGFDASFLDPSERRALPRIRVDAPPASHAHCSATCCNAERAERWDLHRFEEQPDGSYELELLRDWNLCPLDTRPCGAPCGNSSRLVYRMIHRAGSWYAVDQNLCGERRVLRLPRR